MWVKRLPRCLPCHQICIFSQGFDKVLHWLEWLHDSSQPPVWVSWQQLLFDFQVCTGKLGIQSTSCLTWAIHRQLQEFNVRASCHSLSQFATHLTQVTHPTFRSKNSNRFRGWSVGLQLRMSVQAKQSVPDDFHLTKLVHLHAMGSAFDFIGRSHLESTEPSRVLAILFPGHHGVLHYW